MTRHFLSFLFATIGLVGCGSQPAQQTNSAPTKSDKPVVVVTIPMIADLAREIAGDSANVVTLLNPGVDPHTYQPNATDIRAMTSAELVFFNGLKLEAMEADLHKLAKKKPGRVIAVAEAIPEDELRFPADRTDHPDPHIWMNVSLWAKTVDPILAGLKTAVPDAGGEFEARAKTLRSRMTLLDKYVRTVVNTIPKDQRHVVTAHDAFGYFSDAYAMTVSSVQGVTTESQAGVEDVQSLVNLNRRQSDSRRIFREQCDHAERGCSPRRSERPAART